MTSPPDQGRRSAGRSPGSAIPWIGVMMAAGVVVAAFTIREVPAAPPLPQIESAVSTGAQTEADRVVVHVGGAVHRPGLVSLAPGARVADAVLAAGGASTAADLTALNLAATVGDGDQLIVPRLGEPAAGIPGPTVDDGLVDINRATEAELGRLPGVGPVLAGRIVAHRDANGAFEAIEDLLDVAGIGEGKLAAIRDHARAG